MKREECRGTKPLPLLLAVLAMVLAVLACVGTQQLGVLSLGANPTLFTLLGEIDHTWKVDVVPSMTYHVIVQRQNSSHPLNQIQILIQQADESAIRFIGSPVEVSGNSVTTTFTAPDEGNISVIVSSNIGENQQALGTFTIQLLQERS